MEAYGERREREGGDEKKIDRGAKIAANVCI